MKVKEYLHINFYSKVVLTLIGAILLFGSLRAQEDIKADTVLSDSITQYITPFEYAFRMNEETNWLMKLGATVSGNINEIDVLSPISAEFEFRLAPSLTLNSGVQLAAFYVAQDEFNYSSAESRAGLELFTEARWYYRQNKRTESGYLKRNMSDNYFSFGLGYIAGIEYGDLLSFSAKWGIQRRFLKHGFADLGIRSGYMLNLTPDKSNLFFISTYMKLGLAFSNDKNDLDQNFLCPVLKCHESSGFLVKTNLNNVIRFTTISEYFTFSFNPEIDLEKKLWSTPFSINVNLASRTSVFRTRYTYPGTFSTYIRSELAINLDARWYYNLNRRIRKGKTGNGLSANYVFIGMGGAMKDYPTQGNIKSRFYYVGTGIQRLLGEHLYVDFNLHIGTSYDYYKRYNNEYYYTETYHDVFYFGAKLAVGYRF